jgi:Fe-S oxidoreductase
LDVLAPQLESGVPIVGLEPSCTAVLRRDAVELLHDDSRAAALAASTVTFAELLTRSDWQPPDVAADALVQTHCHQHAVLGFDADRTLMQRAGITADIPDSGCCGLAGNFGFERGHYEVSQAVGERVLLPAVREAAPTTAVIADGFSCRTQIAQGTPRRAVHLAEVLAAALSSGEQT